MIAEVDRGSSDIQYYLLLVHGIINLHIVNGSIMPKIPTAQINAPIFMFSEKAADSQETIAIDMSSKL